MKIGVIKKDLSEKLRISNELSLKFKKLQELDKEVSSHNLKEKKRFINLKLKSKALRMLLDQ